MKLKYLTMIQEAQERNIQLIRQMEVRIEQLFEKEEITQSEWRMKNV